MDKVNYIIKGFGHAIGKYKVSNELLANSIDNKMLDGFNPQLIEHSKNFQAYLTEKPGTSPLEYFVGYKMGFHNRNHVTPWPPIKQNQDIAENSLDLLIEAVECALEKSGLDAEDIDGWIVSSVSPQEQAPGIATTLKCYFTKPDNNTPAMTLTSGCAGFNIALRRSLDYFKSRNDLKNILIANTETMSHFLNRERDFVFHATFGDAAAAAVISKGPYTGKHEGVGAIVNYQDLRMIDFVGVDKEWNLYMDGAMVKRRAVPNIVSSSIEVLKKVGWEIDDVDLVIPHQTGNAILHTAAKELNLPLTKLYQGAQHEHGNVSGTTIPIALSMLDDEGKLKPGMKLLCPTAGVGGEYGAWTYTVAEPTEPISKQPKHHLLNDENILVLFADNALGVALAEIIKLTSAQVTFHANHKNDYQKQIEDIANTHKNIELKTFTINDVQAADDFIVGLGDKKWHSTVNIGMAAETAYGFHGYDENAETIGKVYAQMAKKLLDKTTNTMFSLGHAMELAELKEPCGIATVATGWKGLMGSMSGEAISMGVRTIWHVPAIYENLTQYMPMKSKLLAMKAMKQNSPIKSIARLADNIVRGLYLLKVPHTIDKRRGVMIYRKDACAFRPFLYE